MGGICFLISKMQDVLKSDWGRLFRNWEHLTPDAQGFADVGDTAPELQKTGLRAFWNSLGILGTCIVEAPEFIQSRRKETG